MTSTIELLARLRERNDPRTGYVERLAEREALIASAPGSQHVARAWGLIAADEGRAQVWRQHA